MQTFPIAPAGTRPMWVLAILIVAVMVPVVSVLVFSLRGSNRSRFEVSADGLRLRGDLYGRFIPAEQIRSSAARRVDFGDAPDLAPKWKSLGTGLPGYQSGWFRLRNGEKALVYLTDETRAVYVPTTAGYDVLVSPADPDRFVQAIHSMARSSTRDAHHQ